MTVGAFAGVLTAFSTFVGAMYGVWRLARSDRTQRGAVKVQQSADSAAVLLGGWRDIQSATLQEVDRVRSECEKKIAELKAEHDEDRAEWKARERAMQDEIDRLKAQVFILIEAKAREER